MNGAMEGQSMEKIQELMGQVETLLAEVHEICQQNGMDTADTIDGMVGPENEMPEAESEEAPEMAEGSEEEDGDKSAKKMLIIAAMKKKNGMV